jgi:hypothetical protein
MLMELMGWDFNVGVWRPIISSVPTDDCHLSYDEIRCAFIYIGFSNMSYGRETTQGTNGE